MTAKEFLIANNDEDFRLSKSGMNVSEMMIEFAKFHVEAALKQASGKAMLSCNVYDYVEETFSSDEWFDKSSILNAYPLDLIK